MKLLTGVVSLFVSSLIVINQASPLQQPGITGGDKLTPVVSSTESQLVENADDKEEELVDFEDDDTDSLLDLVAARDGGMESMRHLHEKGGEVLVPCFGMWWPIGGGGGSVYDYVNDYYGDYKKRRRSRKKKKAAKMKRKKT